MKIGLTLLLALLLSGCQGSYVDVGLGHVIRSDNYVTCNPSFRAAIGVERGPTYIEMAHSSNVPCGVPFSNNKPETWFEEVRVGLRLKR